MRRASPPGSSRSSLHVTRTTTSPERLEVCGLARSRARRAAVECQRRLSVSTTTRAPRKRKSTVQMPNATCVSAAWQDSHDRTAGSAARRASRSLLGVDRSASSACSLPAPLAARSRQQGRGQDHRTQMMQHLRLVERPRQLVRPRARRRVDQRPHERRARHPEAHRDLVVSEEQPWTTIRRASRAPCAPAVTCTGPRLAGDQIPSARPRCGDSSTPPVASVAASHRASRSSRGCPITYTSACTRCSQPSSTRPSDDPPGHARGEQLRAGDQPPLPCRGQSGASNSTSSPHTGD